MPEKSTYKKLKQRLKGAFRLFCFSLFGFLILIPPGYLSYAQVNTEKKVLVLNSYHRGYRWTDDITEGIESVLKAEDANATLYIEYMDTKRISDERYFHQLYEIYKHKFRDISFDAIISSDDNAFNFLRKHRDEIFPGTPVVFSGVNFFKDSDLQGYELFTGVNEEADFKAGIEIALRLHPDTKGVVVINDTTTTGMKIHEKLMEIIPDYQDSVNFLLLEDIEIEKIQEKLQGLPPDNLVFYTSFYRDKSGRFFEYDESISLIAKACSVPLYAAWDFYLGYGIVGGMLTSGYYQGEAAAKVALRILQGKDVRDIPVIKESPNRYMFDHNQLDRFGISLSELPRGSIVINKPYSLYSKHKRLVWGVIASIAGLALTIFILSTNIFKRKRAEAKLQEAHDRLEERVIERTKDLDRANKQLNLELTERKQAEEALKRTKKELETIVDSVPAIIVFKDKNNQYIRINKTYSDSINIPRDHIEGKSAFDITPNLELAEKYWQDDKEVMASGVPKRNIIEPLPFDETRTVQTDKIPYLDDKGDIIGVIGFGIEITSRVQAEDALRESEEKYRRIVETAQEGIWMINAEAKTIYVNQRLAEMFGYTVKEMLGHSAFDFMDDSNHEEAKRRIERRKRGMKDQYDFKFKRKDGSVLWASVSANPMLDDDGKFIGNFSTISDISDRRRAEEALQESEERYRTLVQNIPIAVYRTTPGPKGRYLVSNPALLKMLGLESEEELKERTVAEGYMNPKDRKAFSDNLLAKGSVDGVELVLKRKDGTPFWGSVTARVEYGEDGKPLCFDSIIMDITARKQAEEEKEKLQAQLFQAQKIEAIGTIAGGIAHNFNNLLMTIIGNTSLMLLETDSDHPNYEKLKIIEKQVLSGSKLTYQLLGYAREGGYEVKPLSLNQLIMETSDTFAITKKEIMVHRELAKDLSGVKADQDQIEQILLNLYVNASDAMPGGGDLFLKTMNVTHKDMRSKPYEIKPGNYVLLTVRDTGSGMDKETMERIFEPFFTTKGMARGTGLGLASVYGIVKAHGGYIDVESKKGHGTTFSIYLPASSEKALIKEKELPQKILKGKESIFLVDDEDMILDVGEEMLKALGYKVILAKSGKEAVELYRKNKSKIDMVLLDMVMPEMGGGETYDRMKDINPDIKVLLSSGYSIDGQATEIIKRGCDGFIQKPFDVQGLSQRIRKILDKK